MAMHPLGPLPASTYWRRRAVLLVLLVVPLLLLKSCVGGDPAPSAKVTTKPTPTSTPRSSGSVSPRPVATSPRPAATTGTCADAGLLLTVRTDAKDYKVGASPTFTLTVKNTGRTPCRRDLGGRALELLVTSGADRIWSSDDCDATNNSSVQTLAAGASLETTVSWTGKRSARGCPANKPQVKEGTYVVVARVGTLRSKGAIFRFTAA